MKHFLTAFLVATSGAPALAHSGAHDGFSGWDAAVAHLLGSPFHITLLVGGAALVGAAAFVYSRSVQRKARQRRT